MQRVTLEEAIAHLGELIDAATKGETILIVGHNDQAVQLTPTPMPPDQAPVRKAGSAEGVIIYMSDDFDAPLEDFNMGQLRRKFGFAAGQIKMSDDFDAPLDDFTAACR
ncbi:MAG: DUF2281 domain-containing protein [Anaerolineae bacterium]|nr:DUF2281 domain-containing protein [Anaerolineae bacterium]